MVKPAVGGVLVGLMGLAIPAVLGTGYGWVQAAMSTQMLGIPLWIVLALPFAKIWRPRSRSAREARAASSVPA